MSKTRNLRCLLTRILYKVRSQVQILYPRPSTRFDPKPLKLPVQNSLGSAEKFENRLLGPTKKVDRIRPMAIAPGLPVTP